MDVRCGSSAARVRHAPTRDREPRRCPGPDDHPEPRPRGRTRRTAGPAHPCADPSSIHPADVRLTPTGTRLVPTLKLLLQQNRPTCEVRRCPLLRCSWGTSRLVCSLRVLSILTPEQTSVSKAVMASGYVHLSRSSMPRPMIQSLSS